MRAKSNNLEISGDLELPNEAEELIRKNIICPEEAEGRISFASLAKESQSQEMPSETREQNWEAEKFTIYSLIYFNVLLIVYNLMFLTYASLTVDSRHQFKTMIVFLPIIQMIQVFINTNFTIRYQNLARIMHIFFSSDLESQLDALSKSQQKWNQWRYWLTAGTIYVL